MLSRDELLTEGRNIRDAALALIAREGEAMDYGALLTGPAWRARGLFFTRYPVEGIEPGGYELTRRQFGIDFEGLTEALSIRDMETGQPVFQVLWNEDRLEVALFRRGLWQDRLQA